MAQPLDLRDKYTGEHLADDMWRSFMVGMSNYRMHLASEEQKYFENLLTMAQSSAGYNGSTVDGSKDGITDWEFAEGEFSEAASIYCTDGLGSCYGEGASPQAHLVGLLYTGFNKQKTIFNASQGWVQELAGDGGWADRVQKFQKAYTGREGTNAANEILTEMAEFRKEKDSVLSTHAKSELERERQKLLDWVEQAAAIGYFDKDETDPGLNYMLPPSEYMGTEAGEQQQGETPQQYRQRLFEYESDYVKEADLTVAVKKLRLGDTAGARDAHGRYVRGIEDRHQDMIDGILADIESQDAAVQTAIDDKAAAIEEYDDRFQTTITGSLNTLEMNLKGSKGLDYDNRFKGATKYYLEGSSLAKGALTEQTLPIFKRGLARNLANYMDLYSEGAAEDEWRNDLARMKKLFPNLSDTEIKVKAVDAYFGPMNDTQVFKLTQGESGFINDWGMDFPGYKGWFGIGDEKEENAEEYMNAQFGVWKLLYDMENDPRLKTDLGGQIPVSSVDPQGLIPITYATKSGQFEPLDSTGVQGTAPGSSPNSILIPDTTSAPLDTALNQLIQPSDTTTVDSTEAYHGGSQDVMLKARNLGYSEDQIEHYYLMTVAKLTKDGQPAPEKNWHLTFNNFLEKRDVYDNDYENYLNATGD